MGLFNEPPQGVTKDEFKRIMGEVSGLPQDARMRLEYFADAYFTRPGNYNRIRKEDFEQFMKGADEMIPPMYQGKVQELRERLEKALVGNYGW